MSDTNSLQFAINYVADAVSLAACVGRLRQHPAMALDLEFDSHRHAYGVTLCLIQVATPEGCSIIDPFSVNDLKLLFELFQDEDIQKIVHSPGEDLRLLHSLGCVPQNVFDTEVVAKLLNYEQSSLSAMLGAKLGSVLNKGQQCSNWLKRPLTQEQMNYAAADVGSLHRLKEVLVAEAEAKGLMAFVDEEQAALSTTIYRSEPKDSFLKPSEAAKLSPYDGHVLNGLFAFRDELARALNRPAFQVMSENLLRDLFSGAVSPAEAPFQPGVYGRYRHAGFGRQVAERLQALQEEAARLGLSRKMALREKNGTRQWTRQELQEAQEQFFSPVQQVLEQRFGTHAARYLLSNSMVAKLLRHQARLADLTPYKQALILEIAGQQSIDLSGFL
ncbi:MAG: hypothetical protein JST27_07115 [Bacteroidetes bacterium]|nr:hypothetical protein [Bacteroidota bacterium]